MDRGALKDNTALVLMYVCVQCACVQTHLKPSTHLGFVFKLLGFVMPLCFGAFPGTQGELKTKQMPPLL
jgi:hypothetical protein